MPKGALKWATMALALVLPSLAIGMVAGARVVDRLSQDPVPAANTELTAQRLTALRSDVNRLLGAKAEELAQLQSVEDLAPAEYRPLLVAAAERYAIEPRLLAALVWVETGGSWNPRLKGGAGEIGLTQILPSTAKWIARKRGLPLPDLTDPATNLDWGAWYLAGEIRAAKGDVAEALRRYNGGVRWPEASRGYSRRVRELHAARRSDK